MNLKWTLFKKKLCLFYYRMKLKLRGHKELYERVYKLEELVTEFHSMQTSALEGISKFSNLIKRIDEANLEQKDYTKKQLKVLETKMKTFVKKGLKEYDEEMDIIADYQETLKKLEAEFRAGLGKMLSYNDKFELINNFYNRFDKQYKDYLCQLKRDISEFKATDQAVRRLASLEGRITMLEGKLQ